MRKIEENSENQEEIDDYWVLSQRDRDLTFFGEEEEQKTTDSSELEMKDQVEKLRQQ